ncbi:MAG: HD domain-containing protein [Defluviitaleaceae bacterium]|nr:HD domain-containing protein [Defluviitaleaceae bacterium]MCL2837266.1 HD domain-containing protein [Defluviitaleaceae bacterium]
MITFDDIRKNDELKAYIHWGNELLGVMGYTDHSCQHTLKTGEVAQEILLALGYGERTAELCKISGYMHDIGNMVCRVGHSQTGAMMAFNILTRIEMPYDEIAMIVGAIGNHDEDAGVPVSAASAALIIADKSDVRRSRVRNTDMATFDNHDRVNYAVIESCVRVSASPREILLDVTIDQTISSVIEYFEIFLTRMLMCKRAAEFLQAKFRLRMNGSDIL